MTEASATSDAENVMPRFEVSREDSIEASSRIKDLLPSRKRGSEHNFPRTPMLEHADGSEVCISKMTMTFTSLGVPPVISKGRDVPQDHVGHKIRAPFPGGRWNTVDKE